MLGIIENVAYFNKDKEEEKSPINTPTSYVTCGSPLGRFFSIKK
jgi:hypothetical protein